MCFWVLCIILKCFWQDAKRYLVSKYPSIELPSIPTLTRLTSKIKRQKGKRQKRCLLIIDKLYVKSILQYHGGIEFRKAANKPSKLAYTVLSFILICLSGGPKLLCRMFPVKELDAMFLFSSKYSCRSSFSNILMLISEMYDFDIKPHHWMISSNTMFKNYCNMHSSRSCQEPEQKILKLSV